MLHQLMEDIMVEKLRKQLENSGYRECFQELNVKKEVIMRGERMVIPMRLWPDVLQAAHPGHPGRESMTKQIKPQSKIPTITIFVLL